MKNLRKRFWTVAIGLAALFLTFNTNAQLYTNGFTNISGNRVGIGDFSPTASLEINTQTINGGTPTGIGYSMFNNPFKVNWKERIFVNGESTYYTTVEKTAFIVKNN